LDVWGVGCVNVGFGLVVVVFCVFMWLFGLLYRCVGLFGVVCGMGTVLAFLVFVGHFVTCFVNGAWLCGWFGCGVLVNLHGEVFWFWFVCWYGANLGWFVVYCCW